MYLPVIAVLGGMLFMRPSGFKESKRDVIRLSPVIAEIEKQQGHITCEPMRPAAGGPAIQAPLHCSLLVKAAQVNFTLATLIDHIAQPAYLCHSRIAAKA